MKIAMLAPISWRTPPRHYGPWEWVVSVLTEGLVRRGVDVTLYATADSLTAAQLRSVAPRPWSEDSELDPKVWECLHISAVFEDAAEFDLIHNNFDFLPLSYCGLVKTPVLTTIHGFSSPRILPVYSKYNGRAHYVAISASDRHPDLDYAATIHHGIPVDLYPYRETPDRYLLFFGRIHHDKGVYESIRLAKQVGLPLVIAGIIQDQTYFDRYVKPYLDDDKVRYIGPVGPQEKGVVLGGAMALLHLINFDEPFGLSVAESMACGTPVIAFNRGSMPELIKDGETGFLIEDLDAAHAAISRLKSIDRRACRRHVEENFTVELMVERYLKLYKKIIAHARSAEF
ncbi:MAG: glycosyltransferase family 4 protein [Dethiobacteria bacterium]|nr:glycosyltransferase family 4 protein [Dethiobacteria bacterium]